MTGDKGPQRLSRSSYGSISSPTSPTSPGPQKAPPRETYLSEKIPIPDTKPETSSRIFRLAPWRDSNFSGCCSGPRCWACSASDWLHVWAW
ncbi:SLC11A1 isoform 3 [Pongo abelii]|uniref:SLC11A1 isoform 3 n=1 Tax=Pongo abelii TaxID=9601 RepID=A0A2J8TU05_PONAB|nr:SLC11A1 isoform 3 [Pongo abelii]